MGKNLIIHRPNFFRLLANYQIFSPNKGCISSNSYLAILQSRRPQVLRCLLTVGCIYCRWLNSWCFFRRASTHPALLTVLTSLHHMTLIKRFNLPCSTCKILKYRRHLNRLFNFTTCYHLFNNVSSFLIAFVNLVMMFFIGKY